MSTRADPIWPLVYSTALVSALPVKSPLAIRREIEPPSAASTAPVAPPGVVTPSNRFTTMQSDGSVVMERCWAEIIMVGLGSVEQL